jgi:hypothetical protein
MAFLNLHLLCVKKSSKSQILCKGGRHKPICFRWPECQCKVGGRSMQLSPNLRFIDPIGYAGFMELQPQTSLVPNNSEWIQLETTFSGTPCLAVRGTTKARCYCGPDQYASQRGAWIVSKQKRKRYWPARVRGQIFRRFGMGNRGKIRSNFGCRQMLTDAE